MKLFCIKLEPKLMSPRLVSFAGVKILSGDSRTGTFETSRQRLAIFQTRAAAVRWLRAHKCENEFWRAIVREVRVIEEALGEGEA